jgi:hypothetical protein
MSVEPSSCSCADTQEKVNLSRRRYGMPANITISAKGNAGCAPVIMIQTSDLDRMDSRHLLTMSVADKKTAGEPGYLSESDLRYFERFIDANRELLLRYWNEGESMFIDDVIEALKFDV